MTATIIILFFLAGITFTGAWWLQLQYRRWSWAEDVSFFMYVVSVILFCLSIVYIFFFIISSDDVRDTLVMKGIAILDEDAFDRLYNVPIVKRRIMIDDGLDYEFYSLHVCPKLPIGKGNYYDYSATDSVTVTYIQGFTLQNVQN
jgi:hypothetical protein